ncbi:hypothetical protein [Arthrobacter sp. SX1312]|uniref:hypothetical protein n=1 Tax=Arthrobacter sp. SX1312 TaxID=2058896 RepID=UPI0011B0291C|nr:hypothetical protein [Arthrobacter sp. SX1312]
MTTQPARRTLSGLAPKAAKAPGVDRLIKANRSQPADRGETTDSSSASEQSPNVPLVNFSAVEESERTDSVTSVVPKYLQLQRREARIHADQADALTMIARRLNAERRLPNGSTVGERITDNTLIRVAIDMLLQHEGEIHGVSEEAIARGLGLEPRYVKG